MTAFQVLGLAFVACMLGVSAWNLWGLRARLRTSLFWLFLWASAGIAIAIPDSTTRVAHALGIVRGADLVFYSTVLFGFVGFFAVYVRFRRLNRELTLLVRRLALQNPSFPHPATESKASGAGD